MKLSFHQLTAYLISSLLCSTALAGEWSVATHDLYPGDFNGDSRTDVLYVAKSTGGMSGVALSNGAEWVAGVQSWNGSQFGLQWHSNAYIPVIGDFNWDGRDDIFMHRQTPGDHYLLLADASGRFNGLSQTIPNSYAGLTWSGDQHRIISIKAKQSAATGDRLFLQAVAKGGTNAIVATSSGMITSSTFGSAWSDGYRGFQWNLRESLVHSGDFNGDGDGDLFIQAKPQIVMIDYEIPIPVPTHRPGSFGIVYSPVASGVTAIWDRKHLGVDWSTQHSEVVIGDFDGDGRDDVLVQPKRSTASVQLLRTSASTNQLTTAVSISIAGASTVSGDNYRVLAANINGGLSDRTFGVYLQGTASSTNDLISHALPTGGGTASTTTQSTQSQTAGQSERAFMTALRYNSAGQVTGTIAPDPDGSGDLKYLATRNTYHPNGLLQKVESGELSAWLNETIKPAQWGTYANFTIFITKEYTYDSYGRKTTELIRGQNLAAESMVQYTYNSKDLVKCKAVRMNPAVYASLLTATPDACAQSTAGSGGPDRISEFFYNDYDQLTRENRGVGVPGFFQSYVVNDYEGKLLRFQTDANGNKTELTYTSDGLGRLQKRIYPSSTATGFVNGNDFNEYTYEPNGNVKTERKRNNTFITNHWDGNNRLIAKDLSDNSYSGDVYYDYDLRGLTLHSRFGGNESWRDGVTNSFDGFGRLKTSQTNMLSTSRTLGYEYDDNSNRERVTHPGGTYFAYEFDGLNRVNRLRESSTSVLTVDYHPNGTREAIERVGGATTLLDRNNAMLLGSFTQDFSGTANDLTNSFLYNPARQVTQLTQSNTLYAYVGNANRVGTYVPNGLNQYNTIGGVALAHDTNGNMTADGDPGRTYTYDMENRLVRAASPDSSFTYDPLGRLFRVTMGSTTRDFLYDGDALVAEYNGGSIVRRYAHGDQVDEPWMQYNINGSSVTRFFLYADHQGSIVAQSDGAGAVTKVTYDSYGIPGGSIDRFGYTGQIWLSELGLFHYKARMYSPKLGRFLQTDPIGYQDGMNIYMYAGNDPMNIVDPLGMNNCEVTPEGTKGCIGDKDAPPDTPEGNQQRKDMDEIIVNGRRGGKKDQNDPDLKAGVASPGEIPFVIIDGDLIQRSFTRTESKKCSNGREIFKGYINPADVAGASAIGHTHGTDIQPGIGPDDAATAKATGLSAYVVYASGISVVEKVGGSYRARLVSGSWGANRGSIASKVRNLNRGGTGATSQNCK